MSAEFAGRCVTVVESFDVGSVGGTGIHGAVLFALIDIVAALEIDFDVRLDASRENDFGGLDVVIGIEEELSISAIAEFDIDLSRVVDERFGLGAGVSDTCADDSDFEIEWLSGAKGCVSGRGRWRGRSGTCARSGSERHGVASEAWVVDGPVEQGFGTCLDDDWGSGQFSCRNFRGCGL